MSAPDKELFHAARRRLCGYPSPRDVVLLSNYDPTLSAYDASVEIIEKAFVELEAARARIKELEQEVEDLGHEIRNVQERGSE